MSRRDAASIWVDERSCERRPAPACRVLDHGLTVGDGVFETLKVVATGPFALTRHLDRLAGSARGLGLPAPDLDAVRCAVARRWRRTAADPAGVAGCGSR